MILILDASVIIAFYSEMHEPQLLHALIDYGYQLVAPIAVVNEILKGRKPTWLVLKKALEEGKIKTVKEFSSSDILAFKAGYPNLDEGEIQVLILGRKLKRQGRLYMCVIDEGPATKIARRNNISRTGTLGLLDKLNDLGIIDEKKKEKLLSMLEHSKFRLNRSHVSANR
jgi:predicted nucleic acid-binding protein